MQSTPITWTCRSLASRRWAASTARSSLRTAKARRFADHRAAGSPALFGHSPSARRSLSAHASHGSIPHLSSLHRLTISCYASHNQPAPLTNQPVPSTNQSAPLTQVRYTPQSAGASGAPLNKHHNYFILVDNGVTSPPPWGAEIEFRAKLEALYREQKYVPSVLLVVQGGPGTLKTILNSAIEETPIVILAESGGAASAVYNYILAGQVDEGFEAHSEILEEIHALQSGSEAQVRRGYKWPRLSAHRVGRGLADTPDG